MKIVKTGDDRYRLTLAPMEARIFVNAMAETIRRIPTSEYQTRMGAEVKDIQQTIASLKAALE
jgi:hypothetical protein